MPFKGFSAIFVTGSANTYAQRALKPLTQGQRAWVSGRLSSPVPAFIERPSLWPPASIRAMRASAIDGPQRRSPPRPLPRRRNPRPAPLLILSETANFRSFRANPHVCPGFKHMLAERLSRCNSGRGVRARSELTRPGRGCPLKLSGLIGAASVSWGDATPVLETSAGLRHDHGGSGRCVSLRRRRHDICWI